MIWGYPLFLETPIYKMVSSSKLFGIFSMIMWMYTILTRHPEKHPHLALLSTNMAVYKMRELAVRKKTLMNKMNTSCFLNAQRSAPQILRNGFLISKNIHSIKWHRFGHLFAEKHVHFIEGAVTRGSKKQLWHQIMWLEKYLEKLPYFSKWRP